MSDFYSAIVFLSAFIMIIMVLLVRSNDLVEYSEKQTILLVIAGAVSEWLAALREQCERLPHVSVGYACYHPERDSIEDVIARRPDDVSLQAEAQGHGAARRRYKRIKKGFR